MSTATLEPPKSGEKITVFGNHEYELHHCQVQAAHDKTCEPAAGCGMIYLMDERFGDRRVTWNKFRIQEINEALATFRDLISKGWVAYEVGENGRKSDDVVKKFDATKERYIFVEGVGNVAAPPERVIMRPPVRQSMVGG